jgi:cell division protein FtsQ
MSKSKKFIVITTWIILCASFGYLVPKVPFFKELVGIKVVEVYGTDEIKKEYLKEIFSNQNWFFIDENEVKNKLLQKYKNIKDIDIKRLFVGKINLYIVEREPLAVVYFKNKKYTVDKDGVVLDGKFNTENLTQIYFYSPKISSLIQKDIHSIILLKEKLEKYFKIKKIALNEDLITFTTKDDKIIVFNQENINSQIEKMKKFISKVNADNYKYLNFSFESMVIARR